MCEGNKPEALEALGLGSKKSSCSKETLMVWFIPVGLVLLTKTGEIKLPKSCPSQFWPPNPKVTGTNRKTFFFLIWEYIEQKGSF